MQRFIFYFVLGSFIGWLMEIFFKTISKESLDRAGMGKGPFCMAYGIGAAFIATNMIKYTDNIVFLFISIAILGTIFEYFTGVIMKKLFNIVLWDYTKLRFGIGKHISLEFVFLWGVIGSFFALKVVPVFDGIYKMININEFMYVFNILAVYIVVDYTLAAFKLLGVKKQEVNNVKME